eukprot:XP_024467388.1 probable protein phosphatase 2C 55 [Populus trichocarpa]
MRLNSDDLVSGGMVVVWGWSALIPLVMGETLKVPTSLRSLKPQGDVNLKKILLKAHSKTVALGSSTACVVTLKRDRLCYANVGDSSFMKGKRRASVFLGEFDVEQGDIVVAGTDGLFDNLFGSEIEEILQETEGRSCLQDLAWTIATVASMNSTSEDYDSPFAVAAESAGIEHIGGKVDDIIVIVAVIELYHSPVALCYGY